MSKDAYKTFEVRTARDYFELLVSQSFEDFKNDNLSSKAAIVCAVFTWHLHEWIWAQSGARVKTIPGISKLRDFQNFLFNECPAFLILAEVANGSKHFDSDRKSIKSTELKHGFYSLIGTTESHLTVKTETELHFFDHILDKSVQYWDTFIKTRI